MNDEKKPDEEKSSDTPVFKDTLTRWKEEKAYKKEVKKATKDVAKRFGNLKLSKKMVKTAVRRIARRKSGRGS